MTYICSHCGVESPDGATAARLRVAGWKIVDMATIGGGWVTDAVCPEGSKNHRLPKVPVLDGQLDLLEGL